MRDDACGCIVLQFKECKCEENEKTVEELFMLPSSGRAVQIYFVDESADTLKTSLTEVMKRALQDFLHYESNRKNGSYVENTIMCISRLDVCVITVSYCCVKK